MIKWIVLGAIAGIAFTLVRKNNIGLKEVKDFIEPKLKELKDLVEPKLKELKDLLSSKGKQEVQV